MIELTIEGAPVEPWRLMFNRRDERSIESLGYVLTVNDPEWVSVINKGFGTLAAKPLSSHDVARLFGLLHGSISFLYRRHEADFWAHSADALDCSPQRVVVHGQCLPRDVLLRADKEGG